MEKYMNMAIKAVITEFPKVGTILNEYGIGCVSCGVGTCLLKDIIEIHNIPKHIETEMMKKVETVITGGDIESAQTLDAAAIQPAKDFTYSKPVQRLVDEHKLIKQFLFLIPEICDSISADLEGNRHIILQSVEFIRTFADKFHHAKEEDILFAYAKGNGDIINVMLEDHKKGRYYVKSMLLGLEMTDASFVTYSMKHYKELLSEHIKKEDEILYPWIEKAMNEEQVEELQKKFDKVDGEFGSGFFEKWEGFIAGIGI